MRLAGLFDHLAEQEEIARFGRGEDARGHVGKSGRRGEDDLAVEERAIVVAGELLGSLLAHGAKFLQQNRGGLLSLPRGEKRFEGVWGVEIERGGELGGDDRHGRAARGSP